MVLHEIKVSAQQKKTINRIKRAYRVEKPFSTPYPKGDHYLQSIKRKTPKIKYNNKNPPN